MTSDFPRPRTKVSVLTRDSAQAKGIPAVGFTAYSYSDPLIADSAEVDLILVGDSLGIPVLGSKNTVAVTMEDMISQCRGAGRTNQFAFEVGEPFMSHQESDALAIRNTGEFIQEGGCHAVNLEGAMFEITKAISDDGISEFRGGALLSAKDFYNFAESELDEMLAAARRKYPKNSD